MPERTGKYYGIYDKNGIAVGQEGTIARNKKEALKVAREIYGRGAKVEYLGKRKYFSMRNLKKVI
jgi:hypothetical protein